MLAAEITTCKNFISVIYLSAADFKLGDGTVMPKHVAVKVNVLSYIHRMSI
jgi:hypothetical protein